MTQPEREQGGDAAGAATTLDGTDPKQKGVRYFWDKFWKVLVAVATVVTIITGIPVIVALAHHAPRSQTVSNSEFLGLILNPESLPIRALPKHNGRIVGYLSFHDHVFIVCTAIGDPVTGPRHGGGNITTPVWDKVRPVGSPNAVGFVPDAWVDTGTVKAKAHSC